MRIRSIVASGALALAVVGGSVAGAGAASAHMTSVPTATGSVALAGPVYHPAPGPIQYSSFFVFGGRGYYHGWIDYANFTRHAFRTNVWNIIGTHQLTFDFSGTPFVHTMQVTTVTPTSTHSSTFSGTGYYDPDTSYTWTVTGTVDWNAVSFTIVYTGTNAGYTISGTGVIARDGSISGSAGTATFTMPAGSAFQVLSYKATVTSAFFWDHSAVFGYRIPWGSPGAGLPVTVKVYDSGPLHLKDSFAMGVLFGPIIRYQITSGIIVVHR